MKVLGASIVNPPGSIVDTTWVNFSDPLVPGRDRRKF